MLLDVHVSFKPILAYDILVISINIICFSVQRNRFVSVYVNLPIVLNITLLCNN